MWDINSRIIARVKNLLTWAFFTLGSSFIASLIMHEFETRAGNTSLKSVGDVYWWWLETVTGVGAAVDPITPEGRILATFIILADFVLLGSFISEFSEIVRMLYTRKEEGNIKVRYTEHIVIIGYTSLTAGVIRLLKKHFGNGLKIVLISNEIGSNPFPGQVDFINDNPISNATLVDSNLENAVAAIILANDRFRDPDTYSLVIASAVEQLKHKIITIVEITDNSRRELFKKVSVEAFINREELLTDLLDNKPDPKLKRIILKEAGLEEAFNEEETIELI